MGRFALAYALLLACALTACGNPRTDGAGGSSSDAGENTAPAPVPRPAVTLRPVSKAGDRFRTTRTLRVEELTESERYLTESEEVTLTEVLRADDAGRLMAVRRCWESSVTRLTNGFGNPEVARGDLDGCMLELTQRANGVEAKLISGDANIRGANFLVEGFDTGLLPLDPVRKGDYWQLEGSRLGGLNRFIEAMQFQIDKNRLTCQLMEVTAATATISLEWRISGELGGLAAVLEFSGELVFDRKAGMISEFSLNGGRQADSGPKQQIEITIRRRAVDGWLDLER
ncbi:MAG: hypothetical protein KDB90_13005 [Planctomycetes bacterium]|nr:hypothetical protein [Planctomycetota bacterium]